MTLAEIVQDCLGAYGARYQCSKAKILQFINTIQEVAYNRDLFAFLWWEDYLTVYQDLDFEASGYTPCVADDVGKAVTDGSVTGTLKSFNNALRRWQVETDGEFSGAITISGGDGAGTLSAQAVSKGPYSWASLVPSLGSLTAYTQNGAVRRMLGLTQMTDAQLLKPETQRITTDYNFDLGELNDRRIFEVVKKYDMQKALFFVDEPSTEENTYRWVYFMRPPRIALETDDVNLLIPAEFHQTVIVEGVGMLADRTTYGDKAPEIVLEPILEPFWDRMQQLYTPWGEGSNFTAEVSP